MCRCRRKVVWSFLAGILLQTCRPAADPGRRPLSARGGFQSGRPPLGEPLTSIATAWLVRLRGGGGAPRAQGRITNAPKQQQPALEKLETMDKESIKHLARKAGLFHDGVQGSKNTSWLDRQYEVALRVLRRRANEAKKQKQREHIEKHGADAATIARAEQVQRLVSEGNYGEIDKLNSFGRHMAKQKRQEELQQNDTVVLTDLLQQHLEQKIADGGSSEITRYDKLVVLRRFLGDNNRSPRLRDAIAKALNLTDLSSSSHAHTAHSDAAAHARTPLTDAAGRDDDSALRTERQRRDAAQAPKAQHAEGAQRNATGKGGQGLQGLQGAQVLSGKKLRKAAAKELREANAYEREEENQPLPPRFKDRVAQYREFQGPALLSADYLEDAVSSARFAWPPLGDPPQENVTQDCKRCRRLKLPECLCSDIHGNWKRLPGQEVMEGIPGMEGMQGGTVAQEDGDSGWQDAFQDQFQDQFQGNANNIVEFEGDEEGDGGAGSDSCQDSEFLRCAEQAEAQGLKMPPRRERPPDVNYFFDEDRGVMTITNNPLANLESIRALNVSGDLPLVNERDDWPWVNTAGLPGSDPSVVLRDPDLDDETALQALEQRQISYFFGPCLPGVAASVR